MATKKINTTRKTVEATPIVENEIVETATIETKTTVEQPVEKKMPRKYEPTDAIPCESIASGELIMTGIKTKISYNWAERGDVTEVEYQDLVAAIRSSKKYVFEPYFIIQDDEFIEQFPQLAKLYETMYSADDLSTVLLDLDEKSMILTIQSLPNGVRTTIKHLAANLISDGVLDSVKKIKALDEYYGTDFMLMSEMSS